MSDVVDNERRKPGRPRADAPPTEPRQTPIYLRWPASLVAAIDAAAGAGNRSAWIEDACRARLARLDDQPAS